MKTIRPLVLLASKRNICGQDRPIRFICCRENGQYSVNRGLNVHEGPLRSRSGGRKANLPSLPKMPFAWTFPFPPPFYSCTAFPSPQNGSLLLWNIFTKLDYQSLFRANFTPRDIVWGDVDESCRLCLFAYDAIRAVCEGWSDLWSIVKECINLACKYSQQQI